MEKREVKSMCTVNLQQHDISCQSTESWILRVLTNTAVIFKLEDSAFTKSKVGHTCSVKCQEYVDHLPSA
jgi:hypothetical protein